MGGHALKEGITRRYSASEYHDLIPEVVRRLARALYPDDPQITPIASLRDKESFGDMDILVESDHLPHDWVHKISAEFQPADMVKNGPVLSFEFRALQIDVILAPREEYGWSLSYFSWGDTGNLIGRIAHKMGLKFGHDGLWLPYRDGDYLFREILVTRDFEAALDCLGLNPGTWGAGFDHQEDVYRFIAAGTYFDPAHYALENRSARDRVRDRKRPMYGGLLEWIAQQNLTAKYTWPEDKSAWLPHVFKFFPAAENAFAQAEIDLAQQRTIQARFNGRAIGEATGRQGKDLGELMREIRESFHNKADFESYVLSATEAEILDYARSMANRSKRRHAPSPKPSRPPGA